MGAAESTQYAYAVVVDEEENGVFVVTCPSLPGCVTQGDSFDDAIKNMKEAVALHLEVMRDYGDPIPPPRPVRTFDLAVAV